MKVFPICVALAFAAAGAAVQAQAQSGRADYVCGGVGVDEQARMKSAAAGHDLMLTFATSTGAYLADVGVQIRDGSGATVLDVNCDGPIMLVDVPGPGTYRITAQAGGVARERKVTVTRGKRPASATFVWPAASS
jgi:type 1 fimbria pilin